MKTSRRILVTLLIVLATASVWANPVNPEQAKQLASGFLSGKTVVDRVTGKRVPRRAPAQNEMETKVVFDATDSLGQPLMYAVNFKTQGGYVLVSGDDRFNEVLGYSDSEQFDEQNMPVNMRAWLQGYVDEMNYLTSIDYRPTQRRAPATATTKTVVEPLITTKWNQGSPYNDLCPIDKSGKRSVTGCAATAMAQIINYHIQHYHAPTALIAEIPGYTIEDQEIEMAAIPEGTAIPEASLLLDTYNDQATDAQKEAVAQLMLYCGVSLNMHYTSTGSGTTSSIIPQAVINYFGFDNTAKNVNRGDYTYADWFDLLYQEMAAGRPVGFGAGTSSNAHAFILDGFDGENMFHFNWGWGGGSNGYFTLSVLNPSDVNQPGANDTGNSYVIGQHAQIGIQINSGETAAPAGKCLSINNLRVDGQNAIFAAFNWTGETHSFDFGIGYVEATGEITPIAYSSYDNLNTNTGFNTLSYTVPTNTDYAFITRKVIPISREKGSDTWCSCGSQESNFFLAEYDADGVPHLIAHPIIDLQVSHLSVPTNKYANNQQTIHLSVTNNGDEYYGSLYLFISTDETIGEKKLQIGLNTLAGSTQDITLKWTPDNAGTYTLSVCKDDKGENVLASTSVTITTEAPDPGIAGKSMVITDLNLDGLDRNSLQIDEVTGVRTYNVYAEEMKGTVSIKNISADPITCVLRFCYDEYDELAGEYILDTHGAATYGNWTYPAGAGYSLGANKQSVTVGKTYRVRICDAGAGTDFDDHFVIRLQYPDPRHTSTMAEDIPNPVYWSITPSAAVAGTTIDLTYFGLKKVKSVTALPSALEEIVPTKIADNHWQYTMPAADVEVQVTYFTDYASVVSAPTAIEGLTYTGERQTLIKAGTASGGTMFYSLDNYTWSTEVPAAVGGNYVVSYKVVADADHLDYIPSPNTIPVSIADFDGSGTADDPYLIPSELAWNHFVNKVNSGTSYEGKHFRQTADISVNTMVGTSANPFKGIYDGAGHTLTVAYNTTEECTAPFRYIEGATIMNLHTAGTITTSNKFAGSIAGRAKCNNTILNCRAGVAITSTKNGDGTHGGIIGLMQGDNTNNTVTTIEGCVFEGKLLGDTTNSCGGFVGWCPTEQKVNLEITNDLFAPQEVTFNTSWCQTFSRGSNISSLIVLTNSYYSQTLGGIQGKQMYSITGLAGVTVANAGEVTEYTVSGITSYGTGIKYDGVLYAGKEENITLALSHPDAPSGYVFDTYTASAGTLTNISETGASLTMPETNVEIQANFKEQQVPTVLDNTDAAQNAIKVIENGTLYILRNDRIFNAQGIEVK